MFIPFFTGVRLYHYQNGQSYLQNYEQFYTRLSQDNSNKKIKWEKLYDFKTVYNVPDLSPKRLLQIYNTIWTKDDLGWLIYLKMYKFNTLNKINGMYHGSLFDLKFVFSKKATKFDEIFPVDLTLTTYFQIDGEDFFNFCGLLRKNEL